MAYNFNFDNTKSAARKNEEKKISVESNQNMEMEKAKNEPNRNSEYDEHLIFVRIVIPAGERLMLRRKKKSPDKKDGTKWKR